MQFFILGGDPVLLLFCLLTSSHYSSYIMYLPTQSWCLCAVPVPRSTGEHWAACFLSEGSKETPSSRPSLGTQLPKQLTGDLTHSFPSAPTPVTHVPFSSTPLTQSKHPGLTKQRVRRCHHHHLQAVPKCCDGTRDGLPA